MAPLRLRLRGKGPPIRRARILRVRSLSGALLPLTMLQRRETVAELRTDVAELCAMVRRRIVLLDGDGNSLLDEQRLRDIDDVLVVLKRASPNSHTYVVDMSSVHAYKPRALPSTTRFAYKIK
jgi:hypothetical protein